MKIFVTRLAVCYIFILLLFTGIFQNFRAYSQVQQDSTVNHQTRPCVVIHKITIEGNKLTHPSIITRELLFHEHDTIPDAVLPEMLKSSRQNVYNTSLFNIVDIMTTPAGTSLVMHLQDIDVTIQVIERWYIWPWPYFVISDRNFNTWLETTDFNSVTYGINMTFFNVRGRNETLVFPIHFGFNQRYGVAYKIPYINSDKTIGVAFGANYDRNHEVVVQSINNNPIYYRDFRNYPVQMGIVFFEFFLRPNIYTKHTFHLEYDQAYLSDSIIKRPGYSIDTTTNGFHYFTFSYQYKNDHRDIQFYPLQGYYFELNVSQSGFYKSDVDLFLVRASFRKYWQIYNRWYFASGLQGKFSLPGDQPYFLQRGLGYGRDYIRGYEYYIVDGQQYLLFKNNFKFALIPSRIAVIDALKSIKFNTIPYAIYLNIFGDFGYVYNQNKIQNAENDLQNKLLVGYGAGLDLTTYYDIVIRLECSINREGTPGLYLHFIAPI